MLFLHQQAQQLQRAMQAQQQYEQSPLFGQLGALQGQAAGNLQGIMGGQQLINPAQQQAVSARRSPSGRQESALRRLRVLQPRSGFPLPITGMTSIESGLNPEVPTSS